MYKPISNILKLVISMNTHMNLFEIAKLAKERVNISFDMVFDRDEKKLKQCSYRYLQTMF